MVKSHWFLKHVGYLWLYERVCFLVDTEAYLGQPRINPALRCEPRRVADAGRGGPEILQGWGLGCGGVRPYSVEVNIRGLKRGFLSCGANFNYVLAPVRLVPLGLSPRWVGLLEYKRYKFKVELDAGGGASQVGGAEVG